MIHEEIGPRIGSRQISEWSDCKAQEPVHMRCFEKPCKYQSWCYLLGMLAHNSIIVFGNQKYGNDDWLTLGLGVLSLNFELPESRVGPLHTSILVRWVLDVWSAFVLSGQDILSAFLLSGEDITSAFPLSAWTAMRQRSVLAPRQTHSCNADWVSGLLPSNWSVTTEGGDGEGENSNLLNLHELEM